MKSSHIKRGLWGSAFYGKWFPFKLLFTYSPNKLVPGARIYFKRVIVIFLFVPGDERTS